MPFTPLPLVAEIVRTPNGSTWNTTGLGPTLEGDAVQVWRTALSRDVVVRFELDRPGAVQVMYEWFSGVPGQTLSMTLNGAPYTTADMPLREGVYNGGGLIPGGVQGVNTLKLHFRAIQPPTGAEVRPVAGAFVRLAVRQPPASTGSEEALGVVTVLLALLWALLFRNGRTARGAGAGADFPAR